MDVQATEAPSETLRVIEKTFDKAERKNERAIKREGYGASDIALVVTQGNISGLVAHINEHIATESYEGTKIHDLLTLIGHLPSEVIALCGLQAVLHGIGMGDTAQPMYVAAGKSLQAEAWHYGLTKKFPALAQRIELKARQDNSSVTQRRAAARAMVNKALKRQDKEYKTQRWSRQQVSRVGNWLVNMVLAGCHDVFQCRQIDNQEYQVILREDAMEKAVALSAEVIMRHPVYLPKTTPPTPWTSFVNKGDDPRFSFEVPFLRTPFAESVAAAKAAIKDGTMQPALDAVTALQSVPWRINQRMYGVIRACLARNIEVPGLPSATDLPAPIKAKAWEDLTDLEQKQWKIAASEAEKQNREWRSERLMLAEDMQTAEQLLEAERFYTAMSCDWRGRVYALPHFNFQREDRVRALFEFADGEPIGDGLRWLQMHVANCGAFDKIDKAPIEERIAWTIKQTPRIQEMVEVPLKDLWWTTADQPFLFLAACMELDRVVRGGAESLTCLPVSFDGSCSGLQHLSAMTRDASTASLVNLTLGEKPNDVYGVIADDVKLRVSADNDPLAVPFLTLGIDRKLAKRNVMTYAYSSKKFGMAAQQQVDLLDEMYKDVIIGKLTDHPFGQNRKMGAERPTRAARYIASHIFDAIEERIHLPAQAMKFLQSIAKALAHESKPVRWVSPTGIPWINNYRGVITERLRLWMHDRGVRSPIQTVVAVGHEHEIDKDKAANGVAPNFVHALDASHLMLTTNAAAAAGITLIATVHDSFGCLASRATEFNKIIRAEFVRMYDTHDVLSEVLEQAKCDLTQHNHNRLPAVPQFGTLNLGAINDATYAFA